MGDGWRWWLYGVDGKTYGECFGWSGYSWDCSWEVPFANLWLRGERKFRCLTKIDAFDIHEAFVKENSEAVQRASLGTARNETEIFGVE